jgi:hypothetical protein
VGAGAFCDGAAFLRGGWDCVGFGEAMNRLLYTRLHICIGDRVGFGEAMNRLLYTFAHLLWGSRWFGRSDESPSLHICTSALGIALVSEKR